MNLCILPQKIAIIKLNPIHPIPKWVIEGRGFLSITYTDEELSIVCSQDLLPLTTEDMEVSLEWRGVKVMGPLDFSLTGILASLVKPLAEENISIFAISTYNTDYLLVKNNKLEEALGVLIKKGHNII